MNPLYRTAGLEPASGWRSDVDVFNGTSCLSTITLQDRVHGIQIREDRLLALAEVEHPDQLEPTRRVDWYEIGPLSDADRP